MKEERYEPNESYYESGYPDAGMNNEPPDNLGDSRDGSSLWFRFPGLIKTFAVLLALLFVGSLVVPFLSLFLDREESLDVREGADIAEAQSYERWIQFKINEVLSESDIASSARFYGLEFDEFTQRPVVGILAEGNIDNLEFSASVNSASILLFHSLFEDSRAQVVVLAWFFTSGQNSSGQSPDLALLMGITRETASGINWDALDPEDLREAVDFYQESQPTSGLLPDRSRTDL